MTDIFKLRGEQLRVQSGFVYESSAWGANYLDQIADEVVTVRGIILATRLKLHADQEPYAYIDWQGYKGSGIWQNYKGAGIWLDRAIWNVVEPEE